jgi:hypothetical protein
MTPAVLLREGYDLDELLDELDREHGGVRVVDVRHEREGGVLGFFARRKVAVSYTVPQENAVTESLTDFDQDATNTEFARMLLEMAAAKAADRRLESEADEDGEYAPKHGVAGTEPFCSDFVPDPIPSLGRDASDLFQTRFDEPDPAPGLRAFAEQAAPAAPIAPRPDVSTTPIIPTPPRTTAGPRGAQLRESLLDLGVPASWLPGDLSDPVATINALAARVPVATPPFKPGSVLVVAGPAEIVVDVARQVRDRLRIQRPLLGVGVSGAVDEVLADEAAAAALRWDADGGNSAVVAVALPEPGSPTSWRDDAAQQRILRQLAPEATWAVADARWRTSEIRAVLAQLQAVDALAVVHATRTVSPAGIWELDLPVALVDGRPATAPVWAALLFDRLAAA